MDLELADRKMERTTLNDCFQLLQVCNFFMVGELSSLESFVHRDISLHLDFREYEGNLLLLALLL